MSKTYQCGCGEWMGEQCNWTGPLSEMVVVEYMPRDLRSSHDAAGNSGSYPANGASRVAVEKSCADRLLSDDDDTDWASIIDADPLRYAVESEE